MKVKRTNRWFRDREFKNYLGMDKFVEKYLQNKKLTNTKKLDNKNQLSH